ncbi:MAG: hypothetical protein ACI8TX_000862 [Hyphomicrobiaceae bacterium]|jgi:hypothetical protein
MLAGLVALLAVLGSTALAWQPPPAVPLPPPGLAQGLIASLFPGVPEHWVVTRLLLIALACAASVVAALSTKDSEESLPITSAVAAKKSARDRGTLLAIAIFTAMLLALITGGPSTRWIQQVWPLIAIAGAALVGGNARAFAGRARPRFADAWPSLFITIGWVSWRLSNSLGSSRRGDLGDFLEGQRCIASAAAPTVDLLRDGCVAGLTYLPWLPFGMGLLGSVNEAPSLDTLTIVNTAVVAVTALCIAATAMECGLGKAAAFAVAVFLGSPLVLMHPLATPIFVFSLYTALGAWIAMAQVNRPDGRKLVLLGIVAGLATTTPNTVLLVAWIAVLLAWTGAWRTGSRLNLIAAVLAYSCMALPSWEAWTELLAAVTELTLAARPWTVWETAVAGQINPMSLEAVANLPIDTTPVSRILGVGLSAWATPRTPMRLWGDVFVEPFGAGLAAIGSIFAIGAFLRASGKLRPSLAFLALAVAMIAPGIASTYDRASLTRIEAIVVPVSLLASFGLFSLRRAVASTNSPRGWWSACIVTTTILSLASGATLFDSVAVRILPQTALRIAIEAVGDAKIPVAFGRRIAVEPTYTESVIRELLPDSVVFGAAEVNAFSQTHLLAWSPGEEDAFGIGQQLCADSDDRTMFVVADPTGLHRVFLSPPIGSNWQPTGLPISIESRGCAARLPTEGAFAERARREARIAFAEGDTATATTVLLEQARASFAQPELFADTAAMLASSGNAEEGVFWMQRACIAAGGRHPNLCSAVDDPAFLANRLAAFSAEAIVVP